MEQVTVGGRYSVRGYRENQLIADKGLIGLMEFRIPVWHKGDGSEVVFTRFVDYVWVGKNNGVQADSDHIGSVGAGLRGSFTRKLLQEFHYGYASRDFDDENDDIQDDGLSFNLSWRLL